MTSENSTSEFRLERDSMGEIQVPADKYWGAQTQRSIHFFNIGHDFIPDEVIHALAVIKKASARGEETRVKQGEKVGRLQSF